MTIEARKRTDGKSKTATTAPARACGYYRVSTTRQSESDLSIPDQRNQVNAYCAARSYERVAEFTDAGASGMDEDRPEFQQMIERACDNDSPFDVIIVHSLSRFFRDAFLLEWYIRKLAKAGVRVESVTQTLGDGPSDGMLRQIIAMFDEYQSKENAKHVLRAMKENARQGFYNGSPPPLGYRVTEVEKRGARVKKKLVIDPVEAETVRLIFRLYRLGDGKSGPLGVKAIACWLNQRGYRTRKGGVFGLGVIHTILINPVYVGSSMFNKRDSRTLRAKPEHEHIAVDVEPIIPQDEFDAVSATLKSRDPRVVAPRVVTGPILLTGLAICATCDGSMTLRTGTSKSGQAHKYYTCSTCARQGKVACKGRSIQMAKLDSLVTDHLVERLLTPARLTEVLASVVARRNDRAAQVDQRIQTLQTEVSTAEDKLKRLYHMVENGLTEMDDILKDRISALKLDREKAKVSLDRLTILRLAISRLERPISNRW
eukprot:gene6261-6333_t